MKLKKWVQAVLLIIATIGILLIIVDPEEHAIRVLTGYILLIVSIGTISEYGTLFDYMKYQIEKFITK